MRYGYRYHDKDGVAQTGEIDAPSREEAFQALHAKGIKPMQFWTIEVPRSAWKLILAVAFLLVFVIGVVIYGVLRKDTHEELSQQSVSESPASQNKTPADHVRAPRLRGLETEPVELQVGRRVAKPRPRKMELEIPDDGQIAQMFKHVSERYLTRYAKVGHVEPALMLDVVEFEEDFYEAIDEDIFIEPSDSPMVVDMKRIVVGLKNEMEMFIDSGKSITEVLKYFEDRQKMEQEFYSRPKKRGDKGGRIAP